MSCSSASRAFSLNMAVNKAGLHPLTQWSLLRSLRQQVRRGDELLQDLEHFEKSLQAEKKQLDIEILHKHVLEKSKINKRKIRGLEEEREKRRDAARCLSTSFRVAPSRLSVSLSAAPTTKQENKQMRLEDKMSGRMRRHEMKEKQKRVKAELKANAVNVKKAKAKARPAKAKARPAKAKAKAKARAATKSNAKSMC